MAVISRKQKIIQINEVLKSLFPDPKCELIYSTDFELLFAIILSAQTTDKQVNVATKKLFNRFKTLECYANATFDELKAQISTLGLNNAKAKNIIDCAKRLIHVYSSQIPTNIEDLQTLSGVGRKTANVYLWEMHGINEGMAIDTHIKRMAIRLGLTNNENVLKIEKDLTKHLKPEEWGNFGHRLILYGRYYWPAKTIKHEGPLNELAILKYKFK